MSRHDSFRYLAGNVAFILLYYAAGRIGLSLASLHPSASPVWPASGIALAALLLLGFQSWPSVFLGAFLVNVVSLGKVAVSLGIATGNTLEAVIGAYLVKRFAGGRQAFHRPEDFLRFVGLAALTSTVVGATVGVTSLALGGAAKWAQYVPIWITWWVGAAVGVLIAAPAFLLWMERRRPAWRNRGLELALLFLTIVSLGWLVFSDALPLRAGGFPLGYLCILPLLWAGLRFEQREVVTGMVLLSGVAIWGTLSRLGPFVRVSTNESLMLLMLFLAAVAVMAIGVGAFVAQGREDERELQSAREDLERKVEERTREISSANVHLLQSESKFRDLLESAPDAMVIVNQDGEIELVNAQTEKLFGYRRGELLRREVEILFPERLRPRRTTAEEGYLASLRLRSTGEGLELFGLRKDGSEFPVDINVSPLETDRGALESAAIRDITRRKQNEASLARLAAVVASSDDAIVSTDTEGLITTWNDAAERLFGYSAAEALGRSGTVLAAPGRGGEMDLTLERLKRQEQVRCETQAMTKEGGVLDIGMTAFPVEDRTGKLIGFSAILRDITEQKRAVEERQEREILKSQVEELSRRTKEIAALNELGDVLRSAVHLSEAYPLIPRYVRELFPAESGALYEHNEGHNLLETALHWGDASPPDDAFLPSECWAMRRGQVHEVEEGGSEMVCQHLQPPVSAGSLCIPLMARGTPLGLLLLTGPRQGRLWPDGRGIVGEYRQRLAKMVAQQIASALFDLRLQESLRDKASRDPLTGLFNRRTLEETLHRELYRAARRKSKVGFVLFDLDHFKRFNDRFGHAAGDSALREVSAFIQKHTRAEDIVCRYGGEEFLLVLSDCTPRNLVRRAEDIRAGVKQLRLEHGQRALGDVTLSAGAALFPDHGRTLDDLFQAADAALYQAKKAGRDQIVVADPLRIVIAPGARPEKGSEH